MFDTFEEIEIMESRMLQEQRLREVFVAKKNGELHYLMAVSDEFSLAEPSNWETDAGSLVTNLDVSQIVAIF